MGRALHLGTEAGSSIRSHAERDYPRECCGLMVGRRQEGAWKVEYVRPARNLNTDRPNDRYLLDPADFVHADREARGRGLDIVGIYHSHPDHPARPSDTDLENAWAALAYLIVGVKDGRVHEWRAWEYDGEHFDERSVDGAPLE
ncbi:MAG: M67 family metallopeptidase [Acidobacteriota bacterium]|nr:M67 family metallopeptidase [Acidobacteriota bacterium]